MHNRGVLLFVSYSYTNRYAKLGVLEERLSHCRSGYVYLLTENKVSTTVQNWPRWKEAMENCLQYASRKYKIRNFFLNCLVHFQQLRCYAFGSLSESLSPLGMVSSFRASAQAECQVQLVLFHITIWGGYTGYRTICRTAFCRMLIRRMSICRMHFADVSFCRHVKKANS